jgi:hypothetical protein
MKYLVIALGVFWGVFSFAETKLNVCSITINSNSEINVFKSSLDPNKFNFIELTPQNKNPLWLQDACEQKITCDTLVVSGHFGGVFFSETNSLTLDLEEMMKSSCNNKCTNIFQNLKEVFLFGCNTLANKNPDHRSFSQYLQVLVNDGISREYAEPIVATRYTKNGLTMTDYFSSIFPNAKRIYGFNSTGPLGAQSAGRLQSYFKAVPNYYDHLLKISENTENQALQKAYAGTSLVQTKGSSYLPATQRDLLCKIYSTDQNERDSGFTEIIDTKNYDLFFNTLLTSSQNDYNFKGNRSYLGAVEIYLNSVIRQYSGLREIQYRAYRALADLNLITAEEFIAKLNAFIESIYASPLDSISFDQVCTIATNENSLIFNSNWIQKYNLDRSIYLPRLVSCFSQRDQSVNSKLLDVYKFSKDERVKTEIVRVLPFYMTQGLVLNAEMQEEVINGIADQASKNTYRAQRIPSDFKQCVDTLGDHWGCWTQLVNTGRADYASCLYAAENSIAETRTGIYWQCLVKFPDQITLSTCLQAAQSNMNLESSDDMKWYCHDHLKMQRRLNSSECYGIARSMVIKGNRIKENWNCNKL